MRRKFIGRVSTHLNPADLKKGKDLMSSQHVDDGSDLRREMSGSAVGSVCQTPKVVPGHKLSNKFNPSKGSDAGKAFGKDAKGAGLK